VDLTWPPDREAPKATAVPPESIARHRWDRLLYNQTAKRLKAALVRRETHAHRRRSLSPRPL